MLRTIGLVTVAVALVLAWGVSTGAIAFDPVGIVVDNLSPW